MPELPEVETVKFELKNKIIGKKIIKISVSQPKVIKNISSNFFIARLENKKIQDIFRRGKYIIIKLYPELSLIFHLE